MPLFHICFANLLEKTTLKQVYCRKYIFLSHSYIAHLQMITEVM